MSQRTLPLLSPSCGRAIPRWSASRRHDPVSMAWLAAWSAWLGVGPLLLCNGPSNGVALNRWVEGDLSFWQVAPSSRRGPCGTKALFLRYWLNFGEQFSPPLPATRRLCTCSVCGTFDVVVPSKPPRELFATV